MKPAQDELLEIAKAELASDVASLRIEGTKVTGKHGMVSANLKTRRLFFRRNPGERPFCAFKIPVNVDGATLTKILTHPMLRGWAALHFDEGMDDLNAVLLAFIIVDREAPVDLRSIKLSPEAAKFLDDLGI
jgi:hypothetical protein